MKAVVDHLVQHGQLWPGRPKGGNAMMRVRQECCQACCTPEGRNTMYHSGRPIGRRSGGSTEASRSNKDSEVNHHRLLHLTPQYVLQVQSGRMPGHVDRIKKHVLEKQQGAAARFSNLAADRCSTFEHDRIPKAINL